MPHATLKIGSICPTCGGVVVSDDFLFGASLGLTPIQAKILATMVHHRELALTRLIELVYADSDVGGVNNATMQTQICFTNRKLKKALLIIKAVSSGWGATTTYRLMELRR